MLLAEANQWPPDVLPYFGTPDEPECHMAFHFPLMPRIWIALRREDRYPIVEIMGQTPEIPDEAQWALFLRNHDELTLEMVTDEERDFMYTEYARDARMRINLGIRRRLAPLVDNSRRRIELLNSLLFSMRGTPVIYYGDEIGMGDNVYLGDRNGVRTPMQWTGDRNAGFSTADTHALYAPLVADPVYGYQAVNVEAQERVPGSLLNWMKRMIGVRQAAPGVRPRHARVPPSREPPRARLPARARWRHRSCAWRTCRASPSTSSSTCRRFAGRMPVELIGRVQLPADRRADLPADPGSARLLLVRADRGPMSVTTVRLATVDDAEAMAASPHGRTRPRTGGSCPVPVLDEWIAEAPSAWRTAFENRAPDSPGRAWVARRDGPVVGYATTSPAKDTWLPPPEVPAS